ncbi:MAG: ExeM/NucH family extracellular endonuclease, partial [Anaerolineales bacterium]|nr:ExeM/NucH family extracellular endonuclease [Anaerolineales bacterium]
DLSGLVLVLFNGSDDASYQAFDLDGFSTDADGYFVLCGNAANVANCDLDVSPNTNLIQNGADAVALFVGDAVDFPNDTPVTTEKLVDAIVYDTSDSDDVGLLVLLNAGQPQVDERGGGDGTGHSNQRCPDGSGGTRNTNTFSQFGPTPGEENACFGECGNPATTYIHDVQGNGPASPFNGTAGVVLEGVVVGDFQDTSTQLKGFFLQEEDSDADSDPMTSEGIFVYDYGFLDVGVGDVVRVKGDVTEYYGLTELITVSDMTVCGTGTASAAPVTLPVSNLDMWEQYEGMLIHIPQTLYATDNYNQGRYGEVTLSVGDRLYNPTNVVTPGAEAIALQNLNDRSQIQLEDGSTVQNPLPLPPYIGFDSTLRAGDTLPSLTGVLHYNFGMYEVHPTGDVEFTRVNERPMEPPNVGGDLTIASFNVLNYFTTIDDGSFICGPSEDMECRGADSNDEFQRQRDKIISAIVAMDADVIGLMEIENHLSDAAVQDLVNGLNDEAGGGTYAFVATGPVGTDAIKVAFIYKTSGVALAGDFAFLDSAVDPTFIDTKNRPALAQTFEEIGSGARFTAVVNHFKSKGSSCNDLGDPDTGDGQGNCNLTRTQAALALVNWLSADPTGSGDPDFIIIGDLNAYAMEDPVAAITGAGYTNLVHEYAGAEAYTYVYFGQAGYLDHALSNSSLTSQVQGAAVWHINADEPSALNYNDYNQPDLYTLDPYRASDHDPVLVGLNPNAVPVCSGAYPSVDLLWPANHKFIAVEILGVTDGDGDVLTITIDSIFQDELVDDGGDGSTWPDGQGVGMSIAEVRAERAADGNGRVYHITFTADDGHGGTCSGEVLVGVPHDSGKKTEMPVDDGANYDSTLEPEALIIPEPTAEPDDKDKKDK